MKRKEQRHTLNVRKFGEKLVMVEFDRNEKTKCPRKIDKCY